MIQVKTITIKEFRGIRNLLIDFRKKNFAVCGPNGTGKSGIVDALEFALTGDISRLSGRGTGNVSLKEHAPHVDSRDYPDKATVILTAYIPHLNKEVKIERNVRDANTPTITPDDEKIREVLRQVAQHPEFVLSRRELINYVLSAPAERAKQVQALLRLDDVETLRGILQKTANAKQKEIVPLKRTRAQAQEQLLAALGITDFTKEKALIAINAKRKILTLPPIIELTETSVLDGLATTSPEQPARIPKSQALTEIKSLKETISQMKDPKTASIIEAVLGRMETLAADPIATDNVSREQFLRLALDSIEDRACPICDTEWNIVDLKKIIATKLKRFEEVTLKRSEIEKELEQISEILEELSIGLSNAYRYGSALKQPVDVKSIDTLKTTIISQKKEIDKFVPLSTTIATVRNLLLIPNEVLETVNAIEIAVTAIPEATEQDAARTYLTIVQERLETYRRASVQLKRTEEQAALTKQISEIYSSASTSTLEGIYKQVEKDFIKLYRYVNREDEGAFTAELAMPASGKLDFRVDFFGRGFFPPGAYHSEGHQDGMGICLYLALMRHLLGEGFTFAVLDDVLMSVDSGHRREVCNLLKEHFPDTQFIFTTHDEIWLRHMKTAGLITPNSFTHFRTWHVDHGPTEWDDRDVWQQIKDDVKKNDVRSAAGLLRHYMEHTFSEICHNLSAPVPFRGDARYEMGDLLPSATAKFKRLLKDGKTSAESWGKAAEATDISSREKAFSELVTKSSIEQWQINPAIHYNSWANLQARDFAPVVESFEQLTKAFICTNPECGSLLYVLPNRREPEELRCVCGNITINLRHKPAQDTK